MNFNINHDKIGDFEGIRVKIDIKVKTALENALNGLGILTSSEFLFLTTKALKDTMENIISSFKNSKCKDDIIAYISRLLNYISNKEQEELNTPISYIWFDLCYTSL